MTNVLAKKENSKEFNFWFEAADWAIRNKLWGKVEIILSNGKYIVVEKAGK